MVYPVSSSIVLRYDTLNRLTNMIDGVGATAFNWTDGDQLADEDGPWADDTISYSYTDRLRNALSLAQPNASAWAQGYGYDESMRLTNVSSAAGVFSYLLRNGSDGNEAGDRVEQKKVSVNEVVIFWPGNNGYKGD